MIGKYLFPMAFVLAASLSLMLVSVHASNLAYNRPIERLSDSASLNWAGYFVNGNGLGYASATWTVPKVSNTVSGYSSAWIGIGGVNGNGALIQTGTEQDCLSSTSGGGRRFHDGLVVDPNNGNGHGGGSGGGSTSSCTTSYYAWWETYPLNAEQKISTMTVSPGDTINAFVQRTSAGLWTISIADITSNQSFRITNVSFTPDQTTAEAIIERPALCFVICKFTNLANFGTMAFSKAAAQNSTNYFDLLSNTPITMVDNKGAVMASPGPLTNPGTFTVTWFRSS